MAVNTTQFPSRSTHPQTLSQRNPAKHTRPSDDEILGLNSARPALAREAGVGGSENPKIANAAGESGDANSSEGAEAAEISPELAAIFKAHPELREAWEEAQSYRRAFESPEAASDAKQQLGELDGLFFSNDPAAHAALAAKIQQLHPESFHRLARAMHERVSNSAQGGVSFGEGSPASAPTPIGPGTSLAEAVERAGAGLESKPGPQQLSFDFPEPNAPAKSAGESGASANSHERADVVHREGSVQRQSAPEDSRRKQAAFFHTTNAAAVSEVLRAIESQLGSLLPESVGEGTRKRLTGEIYRELDATMRSNRQLGKQLREAFRSGKGDAAHQQAIVALVTGRAKQALPSVAKRVIGEWTEAVMHANRERLSRHEKASKRVDISGAGASDGVNRKPLSPRDVDYRRLSDAEILNL